MRASAPTLLALALVLLPLAPGPAAAQAGGTRAIVLLYHLHPDPRAGQDDADPFSSPRAPPPAGLVEAGEAIRLPAMRLDGVLRASDAPEGDPSSALARFRDAQRLLLLREQAGTPLVLAVDGRATSDVLLLNLTFTPAAPPGNASLALRVALFEDGVPDPRAPRLHRFVVRHAEPETPLDLSGPGARDVALALPLDPSWGPARLGVAVSVVHAGPAQGRYQEGEVLQSALWRAGQEGPTVQAAKAVLVEAATATWCDACAPMEEAAALLASQFGASGLEGSGGVQATRPGPFALGGLVAGAAVGVLLLRRRAP